MRGTAKARIQLDSECPEHALHALIKTITSVCGVHLVLKDFETLYNCKFQVAVRSAVFSRSGSDAS